MFASSLLDAACPFNVSYLTHVDGASTMEPGVTSILTLQVLIVETLTMGQAVK
jgi:hypothetical protein